MSPLVFVFALAALLLPLLLWGFWALPGESWQILASVPTRKRGGRWSGTNVTYYGLILACSFAFSAAVYLLLVTSRGLSVGYALAVMVGVVAVALPAASLVARIVERRRHTFTVGGAAFVGLLAAVPWTYALGWLSGGFDPHVHVIPILAAICCAFLFGEGLGRLGCISFGCCYGKPVHQVEPRWLRRLFSRLQFRFRGETKKIAYASNLAGVAVVPIQAITSTVYVGVGLVGLALYLSGQVVAAFLLTALLAQTWRFVSELLRADYRGDGKVSKYQIMALLGVGYAIAVAASFPVPAGSGSLSAGLSALWDPAVIVVLEVLWAVVFVATGRSMVTGAELTIHVRHECLAEHEHGEATLELPLPAEELQAAA